MSKSCQSVKPNTEKSLVNKFQVCTALEGLALDLAVVSGDLQNLLNLQLSIEDRLRSLDRLLSAQWLEDS